MPNIKSAMKRDVKSKMENARNKAQKTALKTALKKFDAAVAEGNKEAAAGTYKVAVKTRRPSCGPWAHPQEQRRSQEERHDSQAQRHVILRQGGYGQAPGR